MDAPTTLNRYPVIRWAANAEYGVALVDRGGDAPFPGRPFVTWAVYRREPAIEPWVCEHGHYDLTRDEAEADFTERAGRLLR